MSDFYWSCTEREQELLRGIGLRMLRLEYNSAKGVDVQPLARHVMELYDVQPD
jgi:hypothetical protein